MQFPPAIHDQRRPSKLLSRTRTESLLISSCQGRALTCSKRGALRWWNSWEGRPLWNWMEVVCCSRRRRSAVGEKGVGEIREARLGGLWRIWRRIGRRIEGLWRRRRVWRSNRKGVDWEWRLRIGGGVFAFCYGFCSPEFPLLFWFSDLNLSVGYGFW